MDLQLHSHRRDFSLIKLKKMPQLRQAHIPQRDTRKYRAFISMLFA